MSSEVLDDGWPVFDYLAGKYSAPAELTLNLILEKHAAESATFTPEAVRAILRQAYVLGAMVEFLDGPESGEADPSAEIEHRLQAAGIHLKHLLSPQFAFVCAAFPFDAALVDHEGESSLNYVTNAVREDAVAALKAWVQRIEAAGEGV